MLLGLDRAKETWPGVAPGPAAVPLDRSRRLLRDGEGHRAAGTGGTDEHARRPKRNAQFVELCERTPATLLG